MSFEVNKNDLEQIMKDLTHPNIKIDGSEVAEEHRHILSIYKCEICNGLPIDPIECTQCDNIYCKNCVDRSVVIAGFDTQKRECKVCKMKVKMKPLNRRVKKLT